ncbi:MULTISPECIES: efflux RND transporter periplasmic adaptor subunit [unclassified Shewanella]|uniref:efflux RND transporter periplasmic adaptor subunit n=1 Tax=unclassified Shewanella TaxID=196818 RepID=UPI001F53D4FD|nr:MULTISPECIES: efflux RND transporter periplasmic adaptor subunit [unclassified Shewanella]MDO6641461.1 efflux RND transporter periplasmic adaptor subunit [Shewanella sp. 5_MG-2023]MDO6679595.1 efflux RND transporter periplasmic adaptor subunit [Shewanella sp. 4_MG-2023]MDO6776556.1 efflux RND transporter periplasmic adaptor subunit [Shewanella sp. 3_MG-2023]
MKNMQLNPSTQAIYQFKSDDISATYSNRLKGGFLRSISFGLLMAVTVGMAVGMSGCVYANTDAAQANIHSSEEHAAEAHVTEEQAPENNEPQDEKGVTETAAALVEKSNDTVDDHSDEALVLSEQQQQLAGINVVSLSAGTFNLDDVATATLIVDRDRTMTIAPQLDVRVLKRHVVPGQEVTLGQVLLTLGGVAVAQAQADYITAAAELSRVNRMNKNTVTASRRLLAQVQAELTRANLEAIKMSPEQIVALTSKPSEIGSFKLLAPISGRVQQDVAMLGQVSAGGAPLMQLTDESHLWVEAQLSAIQADGIESGDKAMVKVGKVSIEGTIIGRSHELNPITRTEQVLVSINNTEYGLHAGQFAELYLPNALNGGVVLPDAALTRGGDGDWQVFIQVEDGFEAVEVEVVERQRGMNMVTGLAPNSQVVISGAFLLASELAKAGFDIHNH